MSPEIIDSYMRKVSLIIFIVQILLIGFSLIVQYWFNHATKGSLEKWINYGEIIMKYTWAPVIFFICSFFSLIFIKEKPWVKILIMSLSIIGFILFDKLYLFPW
jgi:hypothetical protein